MFDTQHRKSQEIYLVLCRRLAHVSLSTRRQYCPTRNRNCADQFSASISCDCWDQPSYSLLCTLPPRLVPQCNGVIQCRQHRIWPCVACPCHAPPHAFGNCLLPRREASSFPDRSCLPRCPRTKSYQRLILLSFESDQAPQSLCLPSFNSLQNRSTPRTYFRYRSRTYCGLFPPLFCIRCSTLHLCFCGSSHLSTEPCSHSAPSPPSCPASSRSDYKVHPRILNFFSNGNLCSPGLVLIVLIVKSSVLSSWLQVPSLRLLDQVLHHIPQVRLRVRQDPTNCPPT